MLLLYYKIPYKQRIILRHFYYRITNFGFKYKPEEGLNMLKIKIILYFFFHPKLKKEYNNEIKFLKNYSNKNFSYSYVFPYDFISNYSYKRILVFRDEEKGLFYVFHKEKRLYFKKSIETVTEVQIAYFCILIEQDKQSPHRYLDNDFDIDQNSVVIDVGAAEGILGLDNIDKISKLYIFEANPEWVDALNATFEPWKDKVTIVNKYVSNNIINDNITLDAYFNVNHIDFIKIDVEGAEMMIFEGAKKILNKDSLKIVVCTYHRQNDAKKIEEVLVENNFRCTFTDKFMLFILVELSPPYFRKGLIRSQKQNIDLVG